MLMFVRACSGRIHAISLGISRLGQVSAARILEQIEGFLNNLECDVTLIVRRLAAVRRLAYEAANAGLLSPEVAAGIRRVKGTKQRGVRLGNWLTMQKFIRFL